VEEVQPAEGIGLRTHGSIRVSRHSAVVAFWAVWTTGGGVIAS
jgi:hypothetical protein